MTGLTRRTVLTGAALAGAAGTLAPIAPSLAAAPPAGKQAAGVYRYKVGTIEVTAVTDGMRDAPLGTLVKNASAEQVNAALQAAYLPKDKFPFIFTPIVVNTGAKLVMIDTGLGPATFEQSKGTAGQAHANLAAAGIDRKAIDAVIISHFHGDHINGLLNADNTPAFPNAEVMVPEPEWAFWMDDAKMSSAPEGLKGNFANCRRVFGPLAAKVTQVRRQEGAGGRHHVDVHARPYAGSFVAHYFIRARTACWCRPTSAIIRHCSSAIRDGMRCSTWMPPWRKPAAASCMTSSPPTRCGCRAFTSRSRRSATSKRTATATAIRPAPWNPVV